MTNNSMKTVSAWLNKLGTHTILDCAAAKADFTKETGEQPCWSDGYSRPEMAKQIKARGKGGSLNKEFSGKLIGSLDVALSCYNTYAGDEVADSKFGMGSQFREYVNAIARAGM